MPAISQVADAGIYGNQQPQQGMSLSDMVGLSRQNLALQKEKATLEPAIESAKAESEIKQTASKKAKLGLDTDFANNMRQQQIALINNPLISQAEKDPQFAAANKDKIAELIQGQSKAAVEMGLDPTKAAELNAPYLDALEKTNGQGVRQFLKTRLLAGLDTQSQAGLQQMSTNALGQSVVSNPIEETRKTLGGQNVNPTTPGVQNFGEYQKDLTNRVAGGTQIDMRLNEAEDLMKSFKAGAGARTYVDIAQKLQAVGAPQDLVDKVAKGDLSAAQSLNKFIAQSVTAGIGAMQGNPTANMMNDYLKNNPDIASDPRALQRFIDFAHKQNEMAYEEQRYLLDKSKTGNLNPDTHVGEVQQHILQKFVKPEGGKEKTISGQGNKQIVRTGKTRSGQKVVEYSDGTREIQ